MSTQLPGHTKITTIERHILDEQRQHPDATGVLTALLYDIALAGKVIASRTTRAGLAEIMGRTQLRSSPHSPTNSTAPGPSSPAAPEDPARW